MTATPSTSTATSFCILSDANLHINAHFFGNHNPELRRDFTWVQALGITIPGSHSLVHLDLGFRFHNLTADVDGVLGQTYSPSYVSRLDIGAKMPVMGGTHKYLSSGLFSTDCAVSKFQHGGDDVTAFVSK